MTQTAFASAAHRYWNIALTREENQRLYGEDASEEGLGSNLRLDLSARTEDEAVLQAPLAKLKAAVDHQALFQDHATSLEEITANLAQSLAAPCSRLRVWESERLSCAADVASGALELALRIDNLTLRFSGARDARSGLLINRAAVREVIARARESFVNVEPMALEPWSEKLYSHLQSKLPGMSALRIDLGSHEYLDLQA